jgi:hypothetical protein
MTKHGSNDLKTRARALAATEGISYTQALARLRSAHGSPAPVHDAAADRWRLHRRSRYGFHWHFTAGSTDLRVDVPDSQNPVMREQLAPLRLDTWDNAVPRFTADRADLVQATLLLAYGRTGREAVEYVDVDLRLDRVTAEGRLTLTWAGLGLAHCTEHESWTEPRLVDCEPVTGAVLLEGDGPQRRITWTPGTVLRVRDVPRTSLQGQPDDGYDIVASSNEDPHDQLRRAGHRLLGMRYRHDIPPAPADASEGRLPLMARDWPATLRRVPADYPDGNGQWDLAVDPAAGLVYVHRSTIGGFFSEYALPLTEERAAVIDAYDQAFSRSPAAYAVAGANAGAAAALAGTSFTPQRLYDLLCIVRVRDAADAAALTGRSGDQWSAAGWTMAGFGMAKPVPQPFHEPADPSKCWRATEAAQLADAGITAYRAYELRTDGDRVRTVGDVIAQDRAVPNEAGRTAIDLLANAAEPVPEALTAELGRARTHTTEQLKKWSDDHRSPFGPQGWGVWVELARHDFTLGDGTTKSLWAVADGWWDFGEDGDGGDTVETYLSDPAARAAWRQACDAHRATAAKAAAAATAAPQWPCPGPGVVHCDNCGSPEVTPNEFLPLDWLSANFGLACGPDCYDAMSDARGRHALRHH